jgi:hypothetical protein
MVFSNCRHLHEFEINNFRFPLEELTMEEKSRLVSINIELMHSVEQNSKLINGVKYYYFRKSKHIIDKIDITICRALKFTEEEINFLINYDLKFRTDELCQENN